MADDTKDILKDLAGGKKGSVGQNVVLIIAVLFIGLTVAHLSLWYYYNTGPQAPPKKKIGVKKAKRERLRQGMRLPAE